VLNIVRNKKRKNPPKKYKKEDFFTLSDAGLLILSADPRNNMRIVFFSARCSKLNDSSQEKNI
jgi:hypothetical protein